jgi:hypothetical protein
MGPIRIRRLPGRAAILCLPAIAALVLPGYAFGTVTPRLVVVSPAAGPNQTLTISASKQTTDDAIGQLSVFVPTGYSLNSPAPGTSVGSATAKVVMQDISPNTEQTWLGTVVAISPTDPSVAYEGVSCDPDQHLAAWMVHLHGSRGTFSFPVFIDATSDATASFGPYVLVVCFRPPDTPSSDPNRSANGTVVDSLTLALTPFVAPTTAGGYLWRSLWTPFTPATGALDEVDAVEAQATVDVPLGQIVIVPSTLTAKVRGVTLTLLVISGQVLVNGEPQGSVLVRVRHGSAPTKLVGLGRVTTSAAGTFTQVVQLAHAQYIQASADVPAGELGEAGCQPSFAGVACVDATSAAGHLVSSTILVRPS